MRYAFYFDQTRCMSCNSCSVACKDWNQVNPGKVRWRKVNTYKKDSGPVAMFNLAMSCNHCEDPACMKACYYGAIRKRADGIVYVNRDLCQGLQACIQACPFAATHIADDKQEPVKKDTWMIAHPMQKCDMCMTRVDNGEKPVCVASCPAHALDWGDYDALRLKYPSAEQITSGEFPYAYANGTTETGPSMLIKKRVKTVVINNGR